MRACRTASIRPSELRRSVASISAVGSASALRVHGIAQRIVQRRGEACERRVAGAQQRDAPARAGRRHESAVQAGEQAGAHERRLAAARDADDREEALAGEPRDELVALPVASEEKVRLVLLVRAQADERD